MEVAVYLIQGPLSAVPVAWQPCSGFGALITFEGYARPYEQDRPISALEYEAYEPMTRNGLQQLGEQIVAKFGLIGLCVEHSVGRVAVEQCSFRLRIASKHRKEGLAGVDAFIDQMKKDVPLWKLPIWRETR